MYTDHKNITHFATTQNLSGRQLRYAEYLAEFDYVIIHRKGSENGRADAISRQPSLAEKQAPISRTVFESTPQGHLKQRALGTVRIRNDIIYQDIRQYNE